MQQTETNNVSIIFFLNGNLAVEMLLTLALLSLSMAGIYVGEASTLRICMSSHRPGGFIVFFFFQTGSKELVSNMNLKVSLSGMNSGCTFVGC